MKWKFQLWDLTSLGYLAEMANKIESCIKATKQSRVKNTAY